MATITRPCPNCQGTRYEVDEDTWALIKLKGNDQVLGTSFALFVVFCSDCGFVQLFNRNTVGEFDMSN